MRYNKTEQGYIALITILVISAVVLLIAASALLFGVSESKMGLQQSQASASYYLAYACAEQALIKLKNDFTYPGDETLTINGDNCYIYPLEGTCNDYRVIKTESQADNQIRKIKVKVLQLNPETIIRSWLEVIDF